MSNAASLVRYVWSWLNDNTWQEYTKQQCEQFDEALAKKQTEINVDKDRYIDVSLSFNDIVTNFNNVKDPNLIGIQRRYDDKMKRRAVRREAVSVDYLKGVKFCFMDSQIVDSKKKKSKELKSIQDNITGMQGSVTTTLDSKVQYLIVMPNEIKSTDAAAFNNVLASAAACGTIAIESTFVNSCISAKKKVDHASFVVSKKTVPVVAATTSTAAAAAATTTTATAVAADSQYFLAGSEWTGICGSGSDQYVMNLNLATIDKAGEINGTLNWPTLSQAVTKFKGTLKDHKITFEEYELVSGDPDEIELPNKYTATIFLDKISGGVDESKFELKLAKSPSVDLLRPLTNYKGSVTQYDQFKLKVTKREDNQLEGTIEWPHYKANCTFKGVIEKETIVVKDYSEGKVLGPEIKAPFTITTIQDKNNVSMKITVAN
ncbi:hypothetical protein SAMD00019534_004830 [Acytostelium subglobosum LB1]|uniref:hypothetical protein n=1 Tax=Acytostelium subglobosum LB1 TaxID=1410327 RepID=UPI00064498B5|nr:hypothetical protein SAMD00019534_004830 [Acytostelium subglobosum LB1]GAM17308.1 hypothetical protein SAMD00019534_004830 [Acytostelium subglobosum LB1]|eukprot:XP_012759370.1 hypothetical protein SAMD00019534_004830 [Acytostelium subglobosum LB1]